MTFSVFDHSDFDRHEQVQFVTDAASGLRAILALHSTRRGPAFGGCRVHPYPTDGDALPEALRLSRGMSHQAALADLPLGGAKMVVLAHPRTQKSAALMAAVGDVVDRLAGRFIVNAGAGAVSQDMDVVATRTAHVTGHANSGGESAPYTAQGLFHCIEAAARHRLGGAGGVSGLRVCVKGLGAVGWRLATLLAQGGAALTVADVRSEMTARAQDAFGATVVQVAGAMTAEVDVVAPCALGAELSPAVIVRLRARVVCGSARNQLLNPADGATLAQRGVAYCPDFLVNAGGLIHSARHPLAIPEASALTLLDALPGVLVRVLERAAQEGRSTHATAEAMAEDILRRG